MKLSTATGTICKSVDLKTAVDILAAAGYDAIDFSQFDKNIYEAPVDRAYLTEIRKRAEDKGLYFNQSHAPFASSFGDEERDKKRFDEIVMSMEKASILGVENIVVHPCQHLPYEADGNPEILFEYNMEFYPRLLPYCEEYNIHVALENMWQGPRGVINHSTCSRADEFNRYLDTLNNPWFVGCLDIGHALLVREDGAEFIKKMGKDRLKCLHVHDVEGNRDFHTLPYFGGNNWEKIIAALKEIGYTGDLTFEADNFYNNVPSALHPAAEKFMCATGRYLISLFEG